MRIGQEPQDPVERRWRVRLLCRPRRASAERFRLWYSLRPCTGSTPISARSPTSSLRTASSPPPPIYSGARSPGRSRATTSAALSVRSRASRRSRSARPTSPTRWPSCAGFRSANGRAAVIGFCYGGPYAILGPKRLGYEAGIACHGSQMFDFIDELEGLDLPVCLIWGDQDHQAPAACWMPIAMRRPAWRISSCTFFRACCTAT